MPKVIEGRSGPAAVNTVGLALGGAMDLVSGVRRVIVVMEHNAKDGSPKILRECSLPITGRAVVNQIITDLCVFNVIPGGGLELVELHPGITVDEVRAKTGTPFTVRLSGEA